LPFDDTSFDALRPRRASRSHQPSMPTLSRHWGRCARRWARRRSLPPGPRGGRRRWGVRREHPTTRRVPPAPPLAAFATGS
jgi:hypothetical protein